MKSVTYQIPISWQNEKPCLHRMIRQERCRVMNEHGAEAVYKNPIAVEKVKGNSSIPSGAETYFGKIDQWEEIEANNLYFDKVIRT